jgi:hypothetical protein
MISAKKPVFSSSAEACVPEQEASAIRASHQLILDSNIFTTMVDLLMKSSF